MNNVHCVSSFRVLLLCSSILVTIHIRILLKPSSFKHGGWRANWHESAKFVKEEAVREGGKNVSYLDL